MACMLVQQLCAVYAQHDAFLLFLCLRGFAISSYHHFMILRFMMCVVSSYKNMITILAAWLPLLQQHQPV
jgi:hypothetical protein